MTKHLYSPFNHITWRNCHLDSVDSDAYTLIILSDPSQKDLYFKKYWGKSLHAKVLKNAEELA
ncbi:hypothetical protein PAXRUDRAFT_722063 [Paxillus rubicundulus Ve08.2h10]|uniref:Uncharacterized protein n=1 Tax=Paxillus rubicundulus Ve08.2h10 TaxID=930991 RepID=A0A0D0DRF3_9AGAM|nr:hypothetical protein PAXRUDRAFT_722063 [Paxillus rubicundulus Ve08.2h10]